METLELQNTAASKAAIVTSETLLNHWMGHRRVTRRMIEAFPEDQLFNYSIGGMRPFSQLVIEMLTMGAPGIRGVVAGRWPAYNEVEDSIKPTTKQELLRLWDEATEDINTLW